MLSNSCSGKLGLVADPVFEAIARLELEDGLRTGLPWRLLVPFWRPHLSQDQFCTTQGVRVGHGAGVVVIRIPVRTNSNSASHRAWVVLNYVLLG